MGLPWREAGDGSLKIAEASGRGGRVSSNTLRASGNKAVTENWKGHSSCPKSALKYGYHGLVPAWTLNYFSGLERKCGIKDTTHMALSGFLMVPHEILSLYPENFSAFILQTALCTKT